MIKHRETFNQWLPALFDGEFEWDFLNPVWHGTKITPMDFDAVVERYGHFLIFETKKDNKGVDLGQSISLTAMWKKGTTIFQIAGKTAEDITGYQIYEETEATLPENKEVMVGSRPLIPGDAFDVVYQAARWFCWAQRKPIPSREEWDNRLWIWDNERN